MKLMHKRRNTRKDMRRNRGVIRTWKGRVHKISWIKDVFEKSVSSDSAGSVTHSDFSNSINTTDISSVRHPLVPVMASVVELSALGLSLLPLGVVDGRSLYIID